MRCSVIVAFLLVTFLSGPAVMATTWYILPDGSGDAPSIQAGIDLAAPLDTILLADGIFTGEGNRNLDLSGMDLTVRSENGYTSTVIDAEGAGRCFSFENGETRDARLEGITLRGGDTGATPGDDGGGVFCTGSSPFIFRCRLTGSVAEDHGGGIFCQTGSSPILVECRIDSNLARIGGGGSAYSSALEIVDCEISDNRALEDGGGVNVQVNSSLDIQRCNVTNNEAGGNGGGIRQKDTSTLHAFETRIDSNRAANWGGGLHVVGNWTTLVSLDSCRFVGNSADFNGGGASFDYISPSIERTLFAENQAVVYGGALYFNTSFADLRKCTLTDNAAWRGGGIASHDRSSVQAECSIISFSSRGEAVHCFWDAGATMSGCDIYGNADGDWTECIETQLGNDGNFSDDPVFCDPGSGDYELNYTSPCLLVADCGRIGAFGAGCGDATSVTDDAVPRSGALSLVVYPNPVRTRTTITFAYPADDPVSISIFDIRGRLVDAYELKSGREQLVWDGRDNTGRYLSSGVYFLRVQDRYRTETERVTLIR